MQKLLFLDEKIFFVILIFQKFTGCGGTISYQSLQEWVNDITKFADPCSRKTILLLLYKHTTALHEVIVLLLNSLLMIMLIKLLQEKCAFLHMVQNISYLKLFSSSTSLTCANFSLDNPLHGYIALQIKKDVNTHLVLMMLLLQDIHFARQWFYKVQLGHKIVFPI